MKRGLIEKDPVVAGRNERVYDILMKRKPLELKDLFPVRQRSVLYCLLQGQAENEIVSLSLLLLFSRLHRKHQIQVASLQEHRAGWQIVR